MKSTRHTATLLLLHLCLLGTVTATDWPQWLGPNRDAVWTETGIVSGFPSGGPRQVWSTSIGHGYSGPSVANGRVYIMDRLRTAGDDTANQTSSQNQERVLCFEEHTGKLLWKHEYSCPYTVSYPAGPRVTPTVDGGRVFSLGAEGHLFCFDAIAGKVNWSRQLKQDYGVKTPLWGFAGHPLVEGQKLICLVGGRGSVAVAFDKTTGRELWRALSAAEPGYCPPQIITHAGRRQLIIFHPEAVNSLDPETGEVFWSEPYNARSGLTSSMPRLMGDQLFCTTFYEGSLLLQLDAASPGATVAWRSPRGDERRTTHLNSIISTPFAEHGFVYGVCSYGQLRCLKAATGERLWSTLQATTSGEEVRWANAFLVKNGGRYFLFNEMGDLIIARLDPTGYQEISRARLLQPTNNDAGRPVLWSHPAFANRRIYVRNDGELACFDLAGPQR
jgi:outer membrane protein assembly factor BamB